MFPQNLHMFPYFRKIYVFGMIYVIFPSPILTIMHLYIMFLQLLDTPVIIDFQAVVCYRQKPDLRSRSRLFTENRVCELLFLTSFLEQNIRDKAIIRSESSREIF